MVLDHVTKRTGFFVVGCSGPHAFSFADGDLDVVDVFVVPDRLENAVGEAHDHEILNGLFPEIMIDPEDLRFVEDTTGDLVDGLGRGEVASDRFST